MAAFQATLNSSNELYTPVPFPVNYDGRYVIQVSITAEHIRTDLAIQQSVAPVTHSPDSVQIQYQLDKVMMLQAALHSCRLFSCMQKEQDVSSYALQYLLQPLEALPSPPSLSDHRFYHDCAVKGLKGGQPDFVLVDFSRLLGPTLLLVAEAKTRYTYPVGPETTAAELYSNPDTRKSVAESVEQAFGYMVNNKLHYSFIFTGEVVTCLKREGRTLLMADVRRDSVAPPALAAIYYLMHK